VRRNCTNKGLKEAMEILSAMDEQEIPIHSDVYASLLEACAKHRALGFGKRVHKHMLNRKIKQTPFLWSKLVNMYAQCGSIENARLVFEAMGKDRTVFSWNAMIAGYMREGMCRDALELYSRMKRDGFKPDKFTFPRVLKACGGLGNLQEAKEVHYDVVKRGLEFDVFIANALMDVYAKCGYIEIARELFDRMPHRDIVSWNTIITGYGQNGRYDEALVLFRKMSLEGVNPDGVSVASVLPACAYMGSLKQGKEIHQYMFRCGIELNAFVGCGLIDMYSKCGRIQNARQVFDETPKTDLALWNAMIQGYALHGQGKSALELFNEIVLSGKKPDHITLLSFLYACNHAGMASEGRKYFYSMSQNYGVTPGVEHYACMVDLLGRAGFLAGRWEEVDRVRRVMRVKGLKRVAGRCWIEVKNRVHTFLVCDTWHPQSDQIYEKLESLIKQIKEAGYVPDTNFVLHDVDEEKKLNILCGHSVKLALAFGLISTYPGTLRQITKNLRVCGDCP
ncbi:hypothetical protein KI387_024335, partial [Taxus chinensis]